MKLLFIGDIVGRIGREAVRKILPDLRRELGIDIVLANAENLAHGIGFTSRTLKEVREAGIDFFTSGNHVFDKPEARMMLADPAMDVIRPANFAPAMPGTGSRVVTVGKYRILVINLLGTVFMKEAVDCAPPFPTFDGVMRQHEKEKVHAVIVDFHGETTSEKVAFGWHAAGKTALVVGTHTHVPTADIKILPGGTAYVTDLGMVGASDSVIGVVKEPVIKAFVTGETEKFSMPESGEVTFNAVMAEIDPQTGKATKIERVDRKVVV